MPIKYHVSGFINYGESILWLLGLTKPVPLDKLEETLSQFKVDDGLVLRYPVARKSLKDVALWEIRSICVTDQNRRLVEFKQIIDDIALLSDCHPALVLSFFLCGFPEYEDDIQILVEDKEITLRVLSPSVSGKAVGKAYLKARRLVGQQVRRRGASDRVKKLLAFRWNYPRFTWGELYEKWNLEHPNWRYKNLQSMEVVHSRATKQEKVRERFRDKFLKNCEQFPKWQEYQVYRRRKSS